jgi:hypothetical protein
MKLFDLRGHSGGVKFVESDGDDEIVTIDVLDTLRVFSLRSRSLEATVKRERDTPAVSCALCIRQHSQRMTTPLLLLGREDGSLDVRAWPTAGGARMHLLRRHSGYSVHLLYWYKSTNTDALHAGASHTCSMSANSSSVPALIPRYSVYLLYEYQSTNHDTAGAAAPCRRAGVCSLQQHWRQRSHPRLLYYCPCHVHVPAERLTSRHASPHGQGQVLSLLALLGA